MTNLSKRQKRFVEGHGCFTNARILDSAIRLGKKSSLSSAILDISKAFDCVSHEAILSALKRRGMHIG
jgi:hypothetical protein